MTIEKTKLPLGKILMVEDDEAYRVVMTDELREEGFEVVTATDGEKGFEMAKKTKPDLILLDLIMPKRDGLTFFKMLRAEDWGKEIPVLLLTQIGEGSKIAEGLELGIAGYLIKSDHTIPEIIQKIKQVLSV